MLWNLRTSQADGPALSRRGASSVDIPTSARGASVCFATRGGDPLSSCWRGASAAPLKQTRLSARSLI